MASTKPAIKPKSIVQVPTPKMVAEWEAISKERCDEMLAMVQKELDRNNRYTFTGMWLGFFVFLVLVACAVYFGIERYDRGVYAFTAASMVGIISNFLGARR